MTRPLLLDLFCGAGGAAMGYHRAGFDVVGVDIKPQPRYPFEFRQADALSILRAMTDYPNFNGELYRPSSYAAIHASPPCQHHANVTAWRGNPDDHPDLLTPTLQILPGLGVPWVIENVPEALPSWDWLLCGTTFGLNVKRHRGFRRGDWSPLDYELSQPCRCYRNPDVMPFEHKDERAYTDAMGCDWMTRDEGRQAIPPAYTEYIGRQLLAALEVSTP
jgi:hypothetical protein